MQKKKILLTLLISSMLTPSASVFAEEMEEDFPKNDFTLQMEDSESEEESFKDREYIAYWLRYQENGQTNTMIAPYRSFKEYYTPFAPTDKIFNREYPPQMEEFLFAFLPYGYDLVLERSQLEDSTWSVFESITPQIKEDQESLLADLPEEAVKYLTKVQDEDLCWTIAIKKWETGRSTPKEINSDLPVYFKIAVQTSTDPEEWSIYSTQAKHASDLNLEGTQQERLTAVNQVLQNDSRTFKMVKPFSKNELVEIKAGTEVIGYTLSSEMIDLNANTWDPSQGGQSTDPDIPMSDGEIVKSGFIGTASWTLDKKGTLTIGSGEQTDEMTSWPWWDFKNEVKKVVGTDSFKLKGSWARAFADLENVESMDLSGWDTSNVTSMYQMFRGSSSLKTLKVSNWKTQNVTNMKGLFEWCSQLEELDVSNWKTSSVTNMDSVFARCSQLKKLDVSNWDTSNVTSMAFMFCECSQIESFKLSGWKTSKVENMDYLFALNENLKELEISNWDTSSLMQAGSMFYEDPQLKTLDLSGWQTINLKDINRMFWGCTHLTSLNIANWCTSNVENMEWLFHASNNLYEEIKYNASCENIIGELLKNFPADWEWEQDGQGPYIASAVPKLNAGKIATLSKAKPTLVSDSSSSQPIFEVEDLNTVGLKDDHITADGQVTDEGVKVLTAEINKPKNNPNDYSLTVEEAKVKNNTNGKPNLLLVIVAKLQEISKINLTFPSLPKARKVEDSLVTESAFFEMTEAANDLPLYDEIIDNGQTVTIKGITVQNAFNANNLINETAIKNILTEEGYQVSNLTFSSNERKNSSFTITNLMEPISIAITTSTPTISSSKGSSKKPKPEPTTPTLTSPAVVSKKATYRFYNLLTREHFYTTSEKERDQLALDKNWSNEGAGWITPEVSDFIIYRVCNPNTGEHHFTMDKNEYDTLLTYGWNQEGIGFYSANPEDKENHVEVYRLFNPKATQADSHHYTVSEEERDHLITQGWSYEGVSWYGLKD